MAFAETKVYFDGSHYIAIPHTTRPSKKRTSRYEEVITVIEDVEGSESKMVNEPSISFDNNLEENNLETKNENVVENEHTETVKKSVSSYAGQIADEFGQQQYTSSAQLTTSSTGVAGQINGGLSALSDKVAEQQTQSPVFRVFNEIVGDKITTTVNSKNARRQATVQIMGGGA